MGTRGAHAIRPWTLYLLAVLVLLAGTAAALMGMPLIKGATGLIGLPGLVLVLFALAAWVLGRRSA